MVREEGFVLYNMRLFDGEANRLQEGKSVVIEGDKISAVEDGGDASRFPGYKMVDMNGKFNKSLNVLFSANNKYINIQLSK